MKGRKHPADMKLCTLRTYWYGWSAIPDWVFPIDTSEFYQTKAERMSFA